MSASFDWSASAASTAFVASEVVPSYAAEPGSIEASSVAWASAVASAVASVVASAFAYAASQPLDFAFPFAASAPFAPSFASVSPAALPDSASVLAYSSGAALLAFVAAVEQADSRSFRKWGPEDSDSC